MPGKSLKMRSDLLSILAAILVAATGALAAFPAVSAEPLRILVPKFTGEQEVTEAVSMTVYFEMLKAFSSSSGAERGAWILYGQDEFDDPSHKGAVNSASWPSVRADIVVWGNATRFGDGIIIDPRITRTPISRQRKEQPEVLRADFKTPTGEYDLSLANSAAFFDLEPFVLPNTFIEESDNYSKGIPIYKSADSSKPGEFTSNVVYFLEVTDKAALVRYDGTKEGWIKFPRLPREDLSMVYFGQGLIHILRGDWRGATRSFEELNEFPSLPNSMRIDTNIYLGIARYKLGRSGLAEFRRASTLNGFDRDAVKFHLIGLLLDYRQKRDRELLDELDKSIEKHQVLFSTDDPWFSDLRRLAADYRQ
jgi:hypothetical protein